MNPALTRSFFRKFIPAGLILVSISTALLFGELVVRSVVNPNDFLYATLIDDPVLGPSIKPLTTGHDALGFRNLGLPGHADIVAIGDSQTYGVSATRENSWPNQLGNLLHKPVYNMALGGYGPLQYLHLAQHQAKKLGPRLLLIGLYFGNDLMDSYNLAHGMPYWRDWRESGDGASTENEYRPAHEPEPRKRFETLRNWLARHSVLYSMLRVAIFPRLAAWEQDQMASHVSPEYRMIWSDSAQPSVRTIFTPQSRLSALDLEQSRVREGLHIMKRALVSMKAEADAQGAQLYFVLIPTKERVYCHYLQETGAPMPVTFDKLCRAEELVKEDLSHLFAAKGIESIDVTGALEKKTREHVQIYPMDSDGHPLATGYGVIADAVFRAIILRQKLERSADASQRGRMQSQGEKTSKYPLSPK